jgi:hypothetical protein
MKKLRLLSLVGITSIALANAGWAAPHGGGGGGFGGGGFSGGGGGHAGGGGGGGGHGGGGRAGFGGGMRGGGAAFGMSRGFSRGGGVGFGRPYFSGQVRSFAGAGPRVSSFARPSYRQPVYSGRTSRTVSPTVRTTTASNRPANQSVSTARSSGTSTQRALSGRIAERHDATWHSDWDRHHAHFFHNRFFVFEDGFWFGLDDGFFPWDYYPYYADDYYPYDYYTDDQSYDNGDPVYNGVPVANATVQAVQTRLAQLGYYNGPVDGVFGPITRDAVAKYQIAQRLSVTGSLSPDTLRSLGLPQATPS